MMRKGAAGLDTPIPAREAYRVWASSYAAENPVTALEDAAVRVMTPRLAGLSLLDAACGTGRRLPRGGPGAPARVIGVDLVFEMLQAGARTDALVAAADMRVLPCRASSFDVVWCRLAAGHLPELGPLYAELARVARAGAHIIVTDFHPAAAHAGHTRSFRDAVGRRRTVEHFVHDLASHCASAHSAGLTLTAVREPAVGPEVRHFYHEAGRLADYDHQQDLPLVLALAWRT